MLQMGSVSITDNNLITIILGRATYGSAIFSVHDFLTMLGKTVYISDTNIQYLFCQELLLLLPLLS